MKQFVTTYTRAILLMALLLLMPSMKMAADEAWVGYDQSTGTLTFHYDANKESSEEKAYSLNSGISKPGWNENSNNITKVVFDESFAQVRPTTCNAWFEGCTRLKTIEGMENLNTSEVVYMNTMFYNCASLSSLDLSNMNTSKVITMQKMFSACTSLSELTLSEQFTGTSLMWASYLFSGCSSLKELDLSQFKTTSTLTNTRDMFFGCTSLKKLDLTGMTTTEVTTMEEMFQNCSQLKAIYVSDAFTVDNVEKSTKMFDGCTSLPVYDENSVDKTKACYYPNGYFASTDSAAWVGYDATLKTLTFHYDNTRFASEYDETYDVSSTSSPAWAAKKDVATKVVFHSSFANARPTSCYQWFSGFKNLTTFEGFENLNTSEVIIMNAMFSNCSSLTELDLSDLKTPDNIYTLQGMFQGCSSLTTLYLSSLNTTNVYDMEEMFSGCSALKYIYVSDNFKTTSVTNSTGMFSGCISLPGFDSSQTDATKACYYPDGYFYHAMPKAWVGYKEAEQTLTFYYNNAQIFSEDDETYDVSSVSSPAWAAKKDVVTKVVFDESFADARPTSCYQWFSDFKNLTTFEGFENLNTSEVITMSAMFSNCTSLTELDLSTFNTSNLTNINLMFNGCTALADLKFSDQFVGTNVTSASYVFDGCTSLKELDFSQFKTTDKLNTTQGMFLNCTALTHIYVSEDFALPTNCEGSQMFDGCTNLPNYDIDHCDQTYAHYKKGGYFTLRRQIILGDKQYNVDGYESPTCYDDVTFTDGAAYSAPCDFTFDDNNTASYTRTVSNHWATLCLPFTFSADDNSTARFYSVKSYDNGNITVTPISGDITDGTPVLAYVEGTELSVSATGAAAAADAKQLTELKGAFQQTDVADDDYIIANDHFWNVSWLKKNNEEVKNVYVAPYRAYLTLGLSTSAKPNSISIGEGETDGIDGAASIENLLDGGVTDPSVLLYDLQGRRLSAPQRGMMIIRKNGVSRKVVLKGL